MMKHSLAAVLAGVALSLSSTAAFSQQAIGNMAVGMVVAAQCTVASDPVDFGNQALIVNAVPITGNLTVQCTADSDYQIQLSVGAGTGATVATRFMTGAASGDLATYTVHQGAATGPVWGVTLGTDTIDGTATGDVETLGFTAVLAAGQSVAADTYTDTLVATINY